VPTERQNKKRIKHREENQSPTAIPPASPSFERRTAANLKREGGGVSNERGSGSWRGWRSCTRREKKLAPAMMPMLMASAGGSRSFAGDA